MPLAWNPTHVEAVQELLDNHDAILGMDATGRRAAEQLFCLVESVLEFSEAKAIDFDDLLDQVRAEKMLYRRGVA